MQGGNGGAGVVRDPASLVGLNRRCCHAATALTQENREIVRPSSAEFRGPWHPQSTVFLSWCRRRVRLPPRALIRGTPIRSEAGSKAAKTARPELRPNPTAAARHACTNSGKPGATPPSSVEFRGLWHPVLAVFLSSCRRRPPSRASAERPAPTTKPAAPRREQAGPVVRAKTTRCRRRGPSRARPCPWHR